MIHPHTRLQFISSDLGYGVFATELIPKGTIVYIKDELEIQIPADSPLLNRPEYETLIRKYSYIEDGVYIISWDIEKYVNHSCDSNTLSTGYGFEIAIRDIHPGEELRDDYGAFNVDYEFQCGCGSSRCRGRITRHDFLVCADDWDRRLKAALDDFQAVPQPLMPYMDDHTRKALTFYLNTGRNYRSIRSLYDASCDASA